jgi:methylphosphotriester-DNA--protein-cysteine methyltransferase
MVAGTNSRLAQAHISGGALHIRGFIDRNLHRTIHVRDLAAVVQRSPAHFARSFKQTFGDPPHAYVTRMRLHKSWPVTPREARKTALTQPKAACDEDRPFHCEIGVVRATSSGSPV